MKKIVLSVAAVAMLFVSCTKENTAGSSENLVKINVSTGFETKAQFGIISEGTYPVLWSEGDKIQLVGFGTFEVAKRAARTGKNPQTGEAIKIAASKAPKFKAGKALKDLVNKK